MCIAKPTFSNTSAFEDKNRMKGFTLLELMVAMAIIGILLVFGARAYQNHILKSELTQMANQLAQYARDFTTWREIYGRYPNDSHLVLPPDAPNLNINPTEWAAPTLLGGNWNWEGPDAYSYAGISIDGATATEEHVKMFDSIVDDGDLSSGKFRQTGGGRFTFIISE